MQRIDLNVTEDEFQRLNQLYPPTVKSSSVGERAIELVKFYFRGKEHNCAFSVPTDGSDLEIKCQNTTQRIEVKGTADSDIAWAKLKVSGVPSHKLLQEGLILPATDGHPVKRVNYATEVDHVKSSKAGQADPPSVFNGVQI